MIRRLHLLRARFVCRGREQGGYVAVVTAVASLLLFGMAAFSVDVGRWYLTARSVQRAADAGALAGVPYLPANPDKAYSTAQTFTAKNGYNDSASDVAVTTDLESSTQLRVTVQKEVKSTFGALLGIKSTKITRSATADYAGPVPLGSPCNEFGNDPEAGERSSNCSTAGQFWANVGSIGAQKTDGDSFQNCDGTKRNSTDCPDSANSDYDANGYFYTITVSKPITNLKIEVFDPALITVGDKCDWSGANLYSGTTASNGGNYNSWKSVPGWTTTGSDVWKRYQSGAGSSTDPRPFCTGDVNQRAVNGATSPRTGWNYSGWNNQIATRFLVRDPGPNSWDPLSFPVDNSCEGDGVYPGYAGDLAAAVSSGTSTVPAISSGSPLVTQSTADFAPLATGTSAGQSGTDAQKKSYVKNVFRKWVTICTIPYATPGTYILQVNTNGLGADTGDGHNRFGIRAFGSESSSADWVSVSGYEKMGIYANLMSAQSKFHLVRVPSGAAGMTLNVEMFDVGDSTTSGKIKVLPPSEMSGTLDSFSGCKATGPYTGALNDCELTNVIKGGGSGGPSDPTNYNGNWEVVSVPIPASYKCDDQDMQKCWFMLQYTYGSGNQPSDTTTWRAWISGDPVRLIK